MIAARPERPRSFILPLLLIVAGAALLLANSGLLSEGAGWRLVELWPLLLVMLGIQLVVSRLFEGRTASVVALVAVGVVALGGLVYVVAGPERTGTYTTFSAGAPLEGATSATLTLDTAGSRVALATDSPSDQLYQASVDYAGAAPRIVRSGADVRITSGPATGWNWNRKSDVMRISLNPSVAWTVVINGAGVSITGDLGAASLRSLTLNGAGARADLALGAPSGVVPVRLAGVGSEITVSVPAGTEYRMTSDGLATSITGTPETPGWAAAADRYDISASGVAAKLTVRERTP